MPRDPVGLLRPVALAEGVSFHLLLGVAMPLKYLDGQPEAVRLAGTVHGGLFVVFVAALGYAAYARGWSWRTVAAMLVAASVPLGIFWLDARLRAEAAPGAGSPR